MKVSYQDAWGLLPLCEVCLVLTRAVKFDRLQGGWTMGNCERVHTQAAERASSLAACIRVIKTLLPIAKKAEPP